MEDPWGGLWWFQKICCKMISDGISGDLWSSCGFQVVLEGYGSFKRVSEGFREVPGVLRKGVESLRGEASGELPGLPRRLPRVQCVSDGFQRDLKVF